MNNKTRSWIIVIAVVAMLFFLSSCATCDPQIIREPYEVIVVLQIPLHQSPAYFFATMTGDEAELWCKDNTAKCQQMLVKDHGLALTDNAKLRAKIEANNEQ